MSDLLDHEDEQDALETTNSSPNSPKNEVGELGERETSNLVEPASEPPLPVRNERPGEGVGGEVQSNSSFPSPTPKPILGQGLGLGVPAIVRPAASYPPTLEELRAIQPNVRWAGGS